MGIQFHRPDAAAVEAALSSHDCRPAGIVLLLAWRAGLTRNEIQRVFGDSAAYDRSDYIHDPLYYKIAYRNHLIGIGDHIDVLCPEIKPVPAA